MRIRQFRQASSRTVRNTNRCLACESLEMRTLLASLTSRLPPIIISPGTNPVEIRSLADPTQLTTLPSAAVQAMTQLATLQDMFDDPHLYPNKEDMLTDLQQEVWEPVAALMEEEVFVPLDLATAIEMATTGFEVQSPPPEVAIAEIFGASLSETRSPAPADASTDADVTLGGRDDAPDRLLATLVGPDEPSELLTTDLVSETEAKSPVEQIATDGYETLTNAENSGKRKSNIVTIDSSERTLVADGEQTITAAESREPKMNGMLLLQLPGDRPGSRINNPDRSPQNALNGTQRDEVRLASADQFAIEEMLLLPMVQDSPTEQQYPAPMVTAGFNPVAMLQIFVGAETDDTEPAAFSTNESTAVGEGESVSAPLLRSERLAAAVLVALVGYWYFQPEESASESTHGSSPFSERRPSRWKRLVKFLRMRLKQSFRDSHSSK